MGLIDNKDRVNKNRKISRRKNRINYYESLVNSLDFIASTFNHLVNKKESRVLSSSTVKFEKKMDERVAEIMKQYDDNNES